MGIPEWNTCCRNHDCLEWSKEVSMERAQVDELVYQALETELGGVEVYDTALRCADDEGLKKEWQKYRQQTARHVEIVQELCEHLGLNADKDTVGRQILRNRAKALVAAMEAALASAPSGAAELVACECVVGAETKNYQNWELLRMVAEKLTGKERKLLDEACDDVEDEKD